MLLSAARRTVGPALRAQARTTPLASSSTVGVQLVASAMKTRALTTKRAGSPTSSSTEGDSSHPPPQVEVHHPADSTSTSTSAGGGGATMAASKKDAQRGRRGGRRSSSRRSMTAGVGDFDLDDVDLDDSDDFHVSDMGAPHPALDVRRDFTTFQSLIHQLFRDFDQHVGGMMTQGGAGGRGGRRRVRGDESRGGFLPSMSSFGLPSPSSMLDPFQMFGGGGGGGSRRDQTMLGRGQQDQQQQQQQQQGQLGEGDQVNHALTTGGGGGGLLSSTPLSHLAPLLDLVPATPPISIRVDVEDSADAFRLTAEVPGLKPNELKVHVDRGVLTIEGRHEEKRDERDKERRFVRIERSLGTVRRSFRLPDNCDVTKIKAKFDHGLLKVDLPKRAAELSTGNVKIESNESSESGESSGRRSGSGAFSDHDTGGSAIGSGEPTAEPPGANKGVTHVVRLNEQKEKSDQKKKPIRKEDTEVTGGKLREMPNSDLTSQADPAH